MLPSCCPQMLRRVVFPVARDLPINPTLNQLVTGKHNNALSSATPLRLSGNRAAAILTPRLSKRREPPTTRSPVRQSCLCGGITPRHRRGRSQKTTTATAVLLVAQRAVAPSLPRPKDGGSGTTAAAAAAPNHGRETPAAAGRLLSVVTVLRGYAFGPRAGNDGASVRGGRGRVDCVGR